jgi:ABC-type Na+ efflux pump permease subunit
MRVGLIFFYVNKIFGFANVVLEEKKKKTLEALIGSDLLSQWV